MTLLAILFGSSHEHAQLMMGQSLRIKGQAIHLHHNAWCDRSKMNSGLNACCRDRQEDHVLGCL